MNYNLSFKERAKLAMELLSKQLPKTIKILVFIISIINLECAKIKDEKINENQKIKKIRFIKILLMIIKLKY